jgi:DNA-directed RNA polymerase subunit RPC12/RpoP
MKNDLDKKIIVLAEIALKETSRRQVSLAVDDEEKDVFKIMELKCPKCGAPMPFPNSYTVRCKYCGTEFLASDIFPQMELLIRSI